MITETDDSAAAAAMMETVPRFDEDAERLARVVDRLSFHRPTRGRAPGSAPTRGSRGRCRPVNPRPG